MTFARHARYAAPIAIGAFILSLTFGCTRMLQRDAAASASVSDEFSHSVRDTQSYGRAWLALSVREREMIVYAELQAFYNASDSGSVEESCARSLASAANIAGIAQAITQRAMHPIKPDEGINPFALVVHLFGQCAEAMSEQGSGDPDEPPPRRYDTWSF